MRRLAFVCAAAMVPAALLAIVLVGYDYYERERSRVIRDSLGTTRALIAAVDTELTSARSALFALATSPHLSSGNLAAFHGQAVDALKDQTLGNVVLMDERGRQLLNTLRPFGAPLPAEGNPQALQRIFQTGEMVVTDLFMGPVVKQPAVAIGVPVRRNGKVVYSLNAGVLPGALSALLSRQRLPPGWIGVVFDSTGTIVARTHESERFVGKKGAPELVERMKAVSEDALETRMLEGVPVLTVFSRSPVSNWTVAIGIPIRELVTELIYSMARLFVAGFIALVSALGLALLMGRRFLRSGET
jgi:hypothetical protein